MDWYQYIDTSRVLVFTLVLTRISGIVMMSPVIGGSDIPVQVRALFAFTLTLLIMPSQWFVTIAEPPNLTAYAILIAAELGIGLSLGLGLTLFFTGAAMAGELIGQIGGLTASQIFDPISGDQTPLLSRLFQYLAVTVFAAVGGLHILVTSLLDTFQTLPPGEAAFQPTIAYSLVTILGLSFNLSIRIAAPVIVAVLIAMLVMGLLGKTLPQLNLMAVGFGINSVIMFAVMALSLGAGIWCFQERIDDVFQLLFKGLHDYQGN
ncbi:MAG: flagellar biosynthetic protein FliR [Planctomycetaceae bacterium]|jgi:flagellar biosynthetic protein FliR|nr:flagellar biosynthetic protein FliR [Planctomycetaceae bacterium]